MALNLIQRNHYPVNRDRNLISHIKAVRASLPASPPVSTLDVRLGLFTEWLAGAQDIGGDDLLADMWREVLRDIIQNDHVPKKLIEILAKIDVRMALSLFSFKAGERSVKKRANNSHEMFVFKHLESLGLVERNHTHINLWVFAIILIFLHLTMTYTDAFSSANAFKQTISLLLLLKLVVPAVTLFSGGIFYNISYPAFQLTKMGERLLKYVIPGSPVLTQIDDETDFLVPLNEEIAEPIIFTQKTPCL